MFEAERAAAVDLKLGGAEDLPGDPAPSRSDVVETKCTPVESLSVRISRESHEREWDSFLARCPGGHHEQTSLWGEVKGFYGWRTFRVIVSRANRIVGGVQLLTRTLGRWGRIGYVMRGPSAIAHDPELIELILGQLDHAAVSEKLAYLVVVPPYNGRVFEPGLVRLGFRQKPNHLPPQGVMTATLLLDLSADLDCLMAGMRPRMREHLRRATRAGVTVREGTGADVETFRQLMWALCERRGTSPTPPQKDFFERLWQIFQPWGFVRLFIAELEGRVISAALTFPFGDTVRIWKIGWAGDHAASSPNAMLYWEAIRWSKRSGYRLFDIVQIENSLARSLQRGDPVDGTSVSGMSLYKIAFGGSPVLLPEPYYRSYHTLVSIFMQAGGRKLIESPPVASLLGRFWSGPGSHGIG
jgi:peptidoglycan pentaglycine glycine transferase (the first glycine)